MHTAYITIIQQQQSYSPKNWHANRLPISNPAWLVRSNLSLKLKHFHFILEKTQDKHLSPVAFNSTTKSWCYSSAGMVDSILKDKIETLLMNKKHWCLSIELTKWLGSPPATPGTSLTTSSGGWTAASLLAWSLDHTHRDVWQRPTPKRVACFLRR